MVFIKLCCDDLISLAFVLQNHLNLSKGLVLEKLCDITIPKYYRFRGKKRERKNSVDSTFPINGTSPWPYLLKGSGLRPRLPQELDVEVKVGMHKDSWPA